MKKRFLIFIFALVFFVTGMVNTNAADEYKGEYTIEYLIKNYNVVTLGTKSKYPYSAVNANLNETKGSVSNIFDIGGPVLIRGDYTGTTELEYPNEFAQKTNNIPSYIKGNVGSNIRPGSPEGDDKSNIYVGSSNTIDGNKINNNNNEYGYTIKQSNDFVDFDKLYTEIVKEQRKINRGTEIKVDKTYYISYATGGIVTNSVKINEPGYYTIDDISSIKRIAIENYDENGLYVITVNSKEIYSFPTIRIYPGTSYYNNNCFTGESSIYRGLNDDDTFVTGNIIFNFPNATYIYGNYSIRGHIIAPQADIELPESHYPGTIIANSISAKKDTYTTVQFFPYDLDENLNLVETEVNVEEIPNEKGVYINNENYTISDLLKNYSIVTLGQKDYSDEAKLKDLTDVNGTASIFHIGGQFLINGNLGVNSVVYPQQNNNDFYGIKLDFREGKKGYHSYIKGTLASTAYDSVYPQFKRYFDYCNEEAWRCPRVYATIDPRLYVGSSNKVTYWKKGNSYGDPYIYQNVDYDFNQIDDAYAGPEVRDPDKYTNYLDTIHTVIKSDNYIDFTNLYNNIVEEQKKIDAGEVKKPDENGNVYLKIAGNYTLENVSELNNIIFTKFPLNEYKLTIVTIKDSGSIELPVIGKGTEEDSSPTLVYTNDYVNGDTYNTEGKKMKYEEEYYGSIVWNIPNATHVKLADGAPFFGHIIAPNADIETSELHFAGAAIVNSLYSEGHTEAHFYPLSTDEDLYRELEYIDIRGTKIWDDKNNQDGKRPESITINLLADGEKIDSVTITEEDNWKYVFKNLIKSNGNGEINYTITEDSVDHYSTEIDGYDITNSYTSEKTSLTVNKVWKDENDADKIRPKSIEVELYANGKKVDTAELSEENDWIYIFNEIDMYSKGERIEYTIKEKSIKGYTTEISGNQESGYTITNIHKVKKDNPKTYDNISKFAIISVITTILLTVGIIVYQKNKKES